MKNATKLSPRTIVSLIIVVLAALLIFLEPFITVIISSAVAAYIFYPLYQRLKNSEHISSGWANALTTILSLVVLIVPFIVVLSIAFSQALSLAERLQAGEFSFIGDGFSGQVQNLVVSINNFLGETTGNGDVISVDRVRELASQYGPNLLNSFANTIVDIISGIPNTIVVFIIYLYLFSAFLMYHQQIIILLERISPFDEKTNKLYLQRISAMTKAMVVGQGVIALVQGFVGALSLLTLGLGQYFAIFFLLLTFLSIIPLGSGIVVIPVGLLALVFGQWIPGIVILFTHFFVTTNVDNILRPRLVPKSARLPAALIILAAFAGVYYFGFLGVIFGPIIMIFLTTTMQVALDLREGKAVKA